MLTKGHYTFQFYMAANKEIWYAPRERCLPSRRNILIGGILSGVITAAGVDGGLRISHILDANKELEPLRPKLSETELETDRKLVAQYDSCQKITKGRCNEVISSRKLAELDQAKAIVKQDDIYQKAIEERTTPDEIGLAVDALGGFLSIPTVINIRTLLEAVKFYKSY